MEKQVEWDAQACLTNQPISPFPDESLFRHPVPSTY